MNTTTIEELKERGLDTVIVTTIDYCLGLHHVTGLPCMEYRDICTDIDGTTLCAVMDGEMSVDDANDYTNQQHDAEVAWTAAGSTYNALPHNQEREDALNVIVGKLEDDCQYGDGEDCLAAVEKAAQAKQDLCSKAVTT